MRLSKFEVQAIRKVFEDLAPGPFELKLFGSRTMDKKKGGDIDLLIVVSEEHFSVFRELKFRFIDALWSAIGEQHIDLLFTTPERLSKDEFLRSIDPQTL